jgi:tRNA(Leu) C34 or U34 (ribose-2'-O)-methylase TrmL
MEDLIIQKCFVMSIVIYNPAYPKNKEELKKSMIDYWNKNQDYFIGNFTKFIEIETDKIFLPPNCEKFIFMINEYEINNKDYKKSFCLAGAY